MLQDAILRHRPLNGWCAALVAGAALGYFLGGAWVWLGAATACVFLAWARLRWASLLLCLACACLLGWRAALAHGRHAHVRAEVGRCMEAGEPLGLTLTVGEDRAVVERRRGGPYCRFTARDARLADGTPAAGLDFAVRWYDKARAFPAAGERWAVAGKLHRVSTRGGRFTLSVRPEGARLLAPAPARPGLRAWLAGLRERLGRNLMLGVTAREALYVRTMTLGSDLRLPHEARQLYADAGIIHVLSISGLHVGIVAALLVGLLSWTGLGLRARALLLAPALIFYVLLVGAPPPAVRAAVMALAWCLAPCFWRRPDAACALAFTAAAVLVWEPALIADVGALLSFAVMGGILLWMMPLAGLFGRLLRVPPREALPPGPAPLGVWLRRALALALGLSLSAWLASIPLCLAFFMRLSVIGLLLNLFLPALTVLVVWGGCVSACVGFLAPWASIPINRLNAALLHFVDLASEAGLSLPWAVLELQARPGLAALLTMEFLFLFGGLALRAHEARREALPGPALR